MKKSIKIYILFWIINQKIKRWKSEPDKVEIMKDSADGNNGPIKYKHHINLKCLIIHYTKR